MIEDDDLLESILKLQREKHVVTVSELESVFDATDSTINNRLNSLHDRGFVEKKHCGSGVVWWIPDRVKSSGSHGHFD